MKTPRPPLVATVHLFVLAFLAVAAEPPRASGAGISHLGNPQMEVLTAKIPPPYSSTFSLSAAFSSWPPITGETYLREGQKDTLGLIELFQTYNTSPRPNRGRALAKDTGTFLSYAEMSDPSTYNDYLGVFSFTQWSQSFRKDAADATLQFTIAGASVYAMCLTTGARAEFAADAWAHSGGVQFYSFHQDAGVKLTGSPPFLPIVTMDSHGPLGYTESNPDGIHRDYLLTFGRQTQNIDLSSVPIGAEFTVTYREMTQANVAYDEVVRAYALYRDPLNDSLGVQIEVGGLTPTDNPQLLPVAVGPSAPTAIARLSAPRPNPAPGPVSFNLELPVGGDVSVNVFDLSGRHVAQLADGPFAAGTHTLRWEPGASRRDGIPDGVYFVRAIGPNLDAVRRVVRIGRN